MRKGWRIGRIFGIDIFIDSSWFVIFVVFTWMLATSYYPVQLSGLGGPRIWILSLFTCVIVFISVLVHELAHSLVAIRQGDSVKRITLFILGGVAQITEEPKEPVSEFVMAVVGPVTSFILASLFFMFSLLFLGVSEPLRAAFTYLAVINTALGIFNLLPGFPMDGGRVLRSILWKMTGNLDRATRIASRTGQAFSFFFVFLGIFEVLRGDISGFWLVFIGWFLNSAAVRGYQQVMMKSKLEGVVARDLMEENITAIPGNLAVHDLVESFILKKKERVFLVEFRDELEGIACLDDVKSIPKGQWKTTPVREIMTPKEKMAAVAPDTTGEAVLKLLASGKVSQVSVMEGQRVIGVICQRDILRYIQLRKDLDK